MGKRRIEAVCGYELAVKLGAVWPQTTAHHRYLISMMDVPPGLMVLRDRATGWPLFWPLQPATESSSDQTNKNST